MNVSLSCEFQTIPALVRANALYANGVLRRKFGRSPSLALHGPVASYGKAALARAFKVFNARKAFEKRPEPSFIVDLNAENAVRGLPAA